MQRKRDKQTKNRPPQSVGLPYCSDALVAITFFVCVVPSDPKTNAGDTIVFFCPFVFSFLFLFLFVFVHKHHAGLEGVACGFLSDIPIILHVSRMGIPCTVSTLEFSNNIAGTCVCVSSRRPYSTPQRRAFRFVLKSISGPDGPALPRRAAEVISAWGLLSTCRNIGHYWALPDLRYGVISRLRQTKEKRSSFTGRNI